MTLKLKIRAKDAPVETAKFMGHGVCDSISRSTTLCSATRDTKIVEKEVQILLKQLKGSTLYLALHKPYYSNPSQLFFTVDCCELRGMGIQFSKLVEDNVSKGKQLIQNSLLNFVARSRIVPPEEVVTTVADVTEPEREILEPATSKTVYKEKKDDTRETQHPPSLFELPSASQIDSAVFNELPDDLKNDIIQEYQRKGIALSEVNSFTIKPTTSSAVNGSSVPTSNSAGTSRSENPVSYDGIEGVADIDASYWSALPDDIKTEIERDIQQRKAESTSPVKGWKSIFKPQRSPAKATSKLGSGKTKAEVKRKTKPNAPPKSKIQPIVRAPVAAAVPEEVTEH